MKILLYIFFIFLFAACRQPRENKKFLTTEFKYSTYIWHLNQYTYKWGFHLADYLYVDSIGHFKLIKHNPDSLDKYFYYSGDMCDSTRRIINSILLENKFFPEIKTDGIADTPLIIYDGFTHLLDYKVIHKGEAKIQYIYSSSRSPENIIFLTSFLDTFIDKTHSNKIDSFSIKSYIDTLKIISSFNLPPSPHPPPSNEKSLRFIHHKERP